MKKRTKIILASIAGFLLVGPFLVPVNTSGTLTNKQAADEVWDGQSQYLIAADTEIHFVTAGDPASKKVLVLLHGFGASALSWKRVIDELSQDSFVIAYDRPAFGFSERRESWSGESPYSFASQLVILDQILSNLDSNKKITLIGHSAGGTLAAAYAIEHPDKFSALILEDPAIYTTGGGPDWLKAIYSIPQLDHLGPLLVSSIASSGLEILKRSYFNPELITDETTSYYTKPLEVKGWEKAFWEFNKAATSVDLVPGLENLELKTLILTGDNDQIVATKDSLKLHAAMKSSDLVVVSECGHLPHEEKPTDFLVAVKDFLRD